MKHYSNLFMDMIVAAILYELVISCDLYPELHHKIQFQNNSPSTVCVGYKYGVSENTEWLIHFMVHEINGSLSGYERYLVLSGQSGAVGTSGIRSKFEWIIEKYGSISIIVFYERDIQDLPSAAPKILDYYEYVCTKEDLDACEWSLVFPSVPDGIVAEHKSLEYLPDSDYSWHYVY